MVRRFRLGILIVGAKCPTKIRMPKVGSSKEPTYLNAVSEVRTKVNSAAPNEGQLSSKKSSK